MPLLPRIRDHRPTVVYVILMLLSAGSLAAGKEAGVLTNGLRTAVSVAATPFLLAMDAAADAGTAGIEFFTAYGKAREEADMLRGQLARAMPKMVALREVSAENERLRAMLGFREQQSGLDLVPVEVDVIGWFEGTLIIDQGSAHGLRESMCVLSPEGIIGVVTKAEPYQSLVYTLHHADCRIGAMIERTRAHGVVRGSGSDFSQICQMEYIDSDADVRVNDRVVTSGSSVFPAGYLIGYVSAQPEGEGSLLKTALVQPSARVYQLDEVFVLREAEPAPEELAGARTMPEDAVAAPAAEDERGGEDEEATAFTRQSLQERYAP